MQSSKSFLILILALAGANIFGVAYGGEAQPRGGVDGVPMLWYLAPIGAVLGLLYAAKFYKEVTSADPGDRLSVEIADHVREGAFVYLRQQYKVVGIFFVIIAVILFLLYQTL